MIDPGEGPGGRPLFLNQAEAQKGRENVFGDRFFPSPGPPLSKGLGDRALPLSQGLDPALSYIHHFFPDSFSNVKSPKKSHIQWNISLKRKKKTFIIATPRGVVNKAGSLDFEDDFEEGLPGVVSFTVIG